MYRCKGRRVQGWRWFLRGILSTVDAVSSLGAQEKRCHAVCLTRFRTATWGTPTYKKDVILNDQREWSLP